MSEQKAMSDLAETIEDSYQGQFVQDILLDEADRRLIVKALNAQARSPAQDAVACTCSQAGFPSSCYNCDAEASDIVNALRKLYSTHPICAQAANYIERKLRDMATPSEPLQCLRCGTVDAFGPAARSPAEGAEARCMEILEDVPGETLVDRVNRLRDWHQELSNSYHDAIAEVRAERDQALSQVENAWRQMSSAPRDGTHFWAYQDGKHYECWWHDDWPRGGYWMDHGDTEPEPEVWRYLPLLPAPKHSSTERQDG